MPTFVKVVIRPTNQNASGHHPQTEKTAEWDHPEKVTADFEDFPNLHPLFVHFPVALLPIALLFQIVGLFVFKREFSWVVVATVLLAFLTAYIAPVLRIRTRGTSRHMHSRCLTGTTPTLPGRSG